MLNKNFSVQGCVQTLSSKISGYKYYKSVWDMSLYECTASFLCTGEVETV